ncbi:MAG: nucleotide exchange factor GrpE [Desulfobacteraceae bacterium]|uniref:Protein GrpE n=1 Tax=Candidatus Desulfacyla euxinica TaxID=2841693 RepID=A0A8J6N075_9DELT|nr:nucleotide exchange factor GrpE [Candidatus Desulfacyla euxinica]MBL6979329.1 nucleotide exchange factor GrpE [Desulfobacteraceae bacterium]
MDKDKNRDNQIDTDSGELEEDPREEGESQDQEEEEIPITKMTKAQLIKKVEKVQEASDKNLDLYIRSQAEIDNLKKRYQKERQDLVKFANESLIKQLLPVVDNLEKAITHSQDEDSIEAIREGIDLTLKGLTDILQKAGVKTVEAVGEQFDPNFHEAVSEMANDRVEPGSVIKDLQKGYILNQRLIRPSMVIVSKKTA